jgi:hypothetical protein
VTGVQTCALPICADLFGIDLDGVNPRGVFGHFRSGRRQDGLHEVQDLEADTFGGLQGLFHQVPAESGDLEIDLKAGNSVAGSGDLEVHVAAMILGAEDIDHQLGLGLVGEQAD